LGVIGPNGSGKTTLVNMITGFVKPTSGGIIYKGRNITNMTPQKIVSLGIARTFQMVRPFYQLPAFKNIVVTLCSPRVKRLLGGRYGDFDAIALDLLEEVGFERDSYTAYKPASTLPQGYLKRMELAKVIALQPDLLILDELFSGLSLAEVAGIVPIIEKLREQGKTIIMIEHRLKELFRLADRIIVLNYGMKIAEGSEEVREFKVLEVRNLMVFFENALALNDFSLSMERGEIVGIIGSNSAGKTTLMNTISGLITHMKIKEQRRGGERITIYGKVIFQGEDITDIPPYLRVQRGLVLSRERHPIFPENDVVENLKIAGYQRKKSEINQMIKYVFDTFPMLSNLKKRKAGFLSGGEQQMLIIGMTLIVKPILLLLDEPLLGLSPMIQTMLVETIKKLRSDSGITILLTEQFARPIFPIIDKGYIIENGMLTLTGKGNDLMDNPEIKAAYFGI
jgi:ABC-type branched-subunit amino acid transport system ATPase component